MEDCLSGHLRGATGSPPGRRRRRSGGRLGAGLGGGGGLRPRRPRVQPALRRPRRRRRVGRPPSGSRLRRATGKKPSCLPTLFIDAAACLPSLNLQHKNERQRERGEPKP